MQRQIFDAGYLRRLTTPGTYRAAGPGRFSALHFTAHALANRESPLDSAVLLAVRWVHDSIRLTRALGTRVLLLPFFGKWALQTRQEMDYTGDALRELAPEAEKADVILGLEDTNSAEDNVRILDRARSSNVQVYYDVGNSTNGGFDVLKEIRWLGKDRICQIHLKDNPNYLGEGKIQFAPIMAAIREIGFRGYAVLETDSKSPATLEADMRRNLAYIRGL